MAKILEWEITQPGYLAKTKQIDVKKNEEELEVIVERLKNALGQHPELPYVTANQVGYGYSVYALRMEDEIEVFANPLMARDGEVRLDREAEFGLDHQYFVPRWNKISVISFNCLKKLVCEREYENEAAGILQHLLNNLDGISLKDTGLEILPEFDAAPKEEQEEVLGAYLKELNKLLSQLEEDIKNDSETSQMYDAYKFVKARAAKDIEAERQVKPNRKIRRFLDKLFKKKGSKK